ncbi:MAG: hypothetical protein ABNH27_01190 [Alcanivorax sp.]|jgi:hypothetical protein|uniref:hypothetical protein n=1 Tax=Alcanivorax sp. TaxID=1872427 RepID=UPI0032D9AB79
MAVSDEIEQEAATVLGYMLFEYSRLDMELGLFLVWSDDGKKLDSLTNKLNDSNFYKRLLLLEKLVQEKYLGTPTADIYGSWLSDAHAARSIRNQLFHGRWGFIPQQQQVANVIGLPTSAEQAETRYSISQLEDLLNKMRELRFRLRDLRQSCPV